MEDKENTESEASKIADADEKMKKALFGQVTDVEIDENGDIIDPDNVRENIFQTTEEAVHTKESDDEPIKTGKPYINHSAAKNVTEDDLKKFDDSVPKDIAEDYNKAVLVANTEHSNSENLPDESRAETEKEFAVLEMPEFNKKSFKKYDRTEVENYVTELVKKYNSNIVKLGKINLKSLERKKTISKIFGELSTKRILVKQLTQKIQELEQKIKEQELIIVEAEQKLFEAEHNPALTSEADTIAEKPIKNETLTVEPASPENIQPLNVELGILEVTDEMRLNNAIATKLEEADMTAHTIRLEATTEATEILAKAQDSAAELMRKAEVEIEELNRSTNEAAGKKMAEAEELKQVSFKILEERNATHRRLIKMYEQQIARLGKQITEVGDVIKKSAT